MAEWKSSTIRGGLDKNGVLLAQVVACAYNSGIWEVEAGESGIQSYPWLHKVNLGYMRSCCRLPRKGKDVGTGAFFPLFPSH